MGDSRSIAVVSADTVRVPVRSAQKGILSHKIPQKISGDGHSHAAPPMGRETLPPQTLPPRPYPVSSLPLYPVTPLGA